jgi:hypothetical protein
VPLFPLDLTAAMIFDRLALLIASAMFAVSIRPGLHCPYQSLRRKLSPQSSSTGMASPSIMALT